MDETTSQMSDEQMDSLVERSEQSTNREIPMTDGKEQAQPDSAQPKVEEYEFDHGGRKYKGTRDQLIAWAKQGVTYPQKMQALNQERTKWEQERKGYEPYKQIDEWAKQNPDKWQKLNEMWNGGQFAPQQPGQPQQGQQPNNEFGSFKQQLLNELQQTLKPIFEEREQAQLQKADQDLTQEIKATREKLTGIDFDSTNDEGRTVEQQILDFAIENKIPKFEVAAKAFLHDQILANAQAQAKLDVSKSIQRDTKLGILGKELISKKPSGFQPAQNVRNRSYNDLEAEAISEMRAMRGA